MNRKHSYNYRHSDKDRHTRPEPGPCKTDSGGVPFVTDIHSATMHNTNFRTALWTGKYLQVTLMSINPNEDVGLELHTDTDQFLRVEQGQGLVKMGKSKNNMSFQKPIYPGSAILIPAGVWHNIINTGRTPLKMYSIYAPPHHPYCTIHKTKKDAEASEAFDDIDLQFLNYR